MLWLGLLISILKTGKGVTEHFGVNVTDVEIIVASNGNALGGMSRSFDTF